MVVDDWGRRAQDVTFSLIQRVQMLDYGGLTHRRCIYTCVVISHVIGTPYNTIGNVGMSHTPTTNMPNTYLAVIALGLFEKGQTRTIYCPHESLLGPRSLRGTGTDVIQGCIWTNSIVMVESRLKIEVTERGRIQEMKRRDSATGSCIFRLLSFICHDGGFPILFPRPSHVCMNLRKFSISWTSTNGPRLFGMGVGAPSGIRGTGTSSTKTHGS
jgi:hypothetical protein